jgi:DNA invertase Pin-like site-specific DNA recombinase
MQNTIEAEGPAPKRCAIYTRKSLEPPLGQEVTSLESQRAICSSYIMSQQHKGWFELARSYEDLGRSGANLDRPALRELVADIERGLVDIVVVYKLDRISRTLLDFVRLIDFFDRYRVAFVAITQNFDTSDSLGRLIRNVLLTFAQFEREIASDRMRDKKMVMKQRGLWTGGDAPIGYDLRCGKLIANSLEAPAIRRAFEVYVETKRLSAVHKTLVAEAYRRKLWKTKSGTLKGGSPISLSSLHYVLHNPVYIGDVTYKREQHRGIHQPIVDRSLWECAQAVLKERQQFKPRQPTHILTGVLYDSQGRRMHARGYPRRGAKGSEFVRYYASAVEKWALSQKVRPARAQADQLERLVLESIKELLADRVRLRPILMQASIFGSVLDALCDSAPASAIRLGKLRIRQLSGAAKALLSRVEIAPDCVRLVLRAFALAKFIGWDGVGNFALTDLELDRATQMHVLVIPVSVSRQRKISWLPLRRRAKDCSSPDSRLVRLMQEARSAQSLVFGNRDHSVSDLARMAGRRVGSFSRLVRLNYLAPDIVAAILDGTQPADLTRRRLIECDLPIDWALQRRLLGFPPSDELPAARSVARLGGRTADVRSGFQSSRGPGGS